MSYVFKYKLSIIGLFMGSVAGYLYYLLIGCESGTCPITSNPLNSTLYGAMLGYFTLNIFKTEQHES